MLRECCVANPCINTLGNAVCAFLASAFKFNASRRFFLRCRAAAGNRGNYVSPKSVMSFRAPDFRAGQMAPAPGPLRDHSL